MQAKSIFISYRRACGSAFQAIEIHRQLVARFGEGSAFIDVKGMPIGRKFQKHLEEQLRNCRVFVAVIGDRWAVDRNGKQLFERPRDFVRLEIEEALRREIPVVPVVLSPARMPEVEELPEGMRELVEYHGVEVKKPADFGRAMEALMEGIAELLAEEGSAEEVAEVGEEVEVNGTDVRVEDKQDEFEEFRFEIATVDARGEISRRLGRAKRFVDACGGGVEIEMVHIPGGSFVMGSPEGEEGHYKDEGPQHEVTVQPFAMGRYPVTQAQYRAVMGENPSSFTGDNRQPVECVSWDNAKAFCDRLSERTGRSYRLPSEAEWEYACRAGTTTPFHFGETITTDLTNYNGNYVYGSGSPGKFRKQTMVVGGLDVMNAFGLSDMHGNVWEWCEDLWHDNYEGAPSRGNPWIEGESERRLLRGGSWYDFPGDCRSASRDPYSRAFIYYDVGFRVCCVPPSPFLSP